MESFSIIILLIIGIAIVLAVYVLIKGGRRKLTSAQQKFINKQWDKIMIESKSNPYNAIMDADKLLAYLLEVRGYKGSVGEMLKQSKPLFRNVNEVWDAHKMRNKVAHEIGVSLSIQEVERTLSKFKRAYRNLGAKL